MIPPVSTETSPYITLQKVHTIRSAALIHIARISLSPRVGIHIAVLEC